MKLDDKLSDYFGESFNNGGKDNITILNCLLHNAGLAPDPVPWYWDPSFGCPNTFHEYPEQDFSCLSSQIFSSLMQEKLNAPPGEEYVYSDIGFILLSYVVGSVVISNGLVDPSSYLDVCKDPNYAGQQGVDKLCAFESFVRQDIFQRHIYSDGSNMMPHTSFLPSTTLWSNCAPTLNDTGDGSYTHKRLQGQVADGDCYAMGGIAGHAGVFSTAHDISNFLEFTLDTIIENKGETNFLNSSTLKYFTSIYNESQSSRALGWSTNSDKVFFLEFCFEYHVVNPL